MYFLSDTERTCKRGCKKDSTKNNFFSHWYICYLRARHELKELCTGVRNGKKHNDSPCNIILSLFGILHGSGWDFNKCFHYCSGRARKTFSYYSSIISWLSLHLPLYIPPFGDFWIFITWCHLCPLLVKWCSAKSFKISHLVNSSPALFYYFFFFSLNIVSFICFSAVSTRWPNWKRFSAQPYGQSVSSIFPNPGIPIFAYIVQNCTFHHVVLLHI